jgi:hypothetical protein
MTTLTPAYHAGHSNPDDHRHDMRPMLYPRFEGSWACKRIYETAEQLESNGDPATFESVKSIQAVSQGYDRA